MRPSLAFGILALSHVFYAGLATLYKSSLPLEGQLPCLFVPLGFLVLGALEALTLCEALEVSEVGEGGGGLLGPVQQGGFKKGLDVITSEHDRLQRRLRKPGFWLGKGAMSSGETRHIASWGLSS